MKKQTLEIYKGTTKIQKYYEFCILARWLFILRILYVTIMNTNRSELRVLLKLCWKDYLHLKKKTIYFLYNGKYTDEFLFYNLFYKPTREIKLWFFPRVTSGKLLKNHKKQKTRFFPIIPFIPASAKFRWTISASENFKESFTKSWFDVPTS